jgi:RimJ/RimL family protein N-acetyltransferase
LFEEAEQQAVRLGYYFKETAWARGYASDCLAGLLNVCEDLGVAVIAGVVTANGASIRVLEKRGFRRIAQNGNVVEYIWLPWKG